MEKQEANRLERIDVKAIMLKNSLLMLYLQVDILFRANIQGHERGAENGDIC